MNFNINHIALTTLFVTLVYLNRCSCDYNTDFIKKRYCGTYLTDTLAAVCRGNYNTLRPVYTMKKKSYWDPSISNDLTPSEYPFQTRQQATSMLRNYGKKRRRRGVYNECCEKSCSHEQLSMYCADPVKNNRKRRSSSFFGS